MCCPSSILRCGSGSRSVPTSRLLANSMSAEYIKLRPLVNRSCTFVLFNLQLHKR
jgi:hypothetical protein